jgi:DNA adenine methylase
MATDSAPIVRQSVSILSPLRYPGAKRRLGSYVAEALRINGMAPKIFVEPFAGGLSVALQLLQDDLVEKIAVGEKDPLVASFWKVAFFDTDWLKVALASEKVSLERWKYFRESTFKTDRERALACLFLNRTSFSGILAKSAGPIGGKLQKSKFKIDCRYSVETLHRRLDKLALLKEKVLFVQNKGWRATIKRVLNQAYKENEVFFYLDPPFYFKADRLYRHYFAKKEHARLRDELVKLKHPWLLSYDNAEAIRRQYAENGSVPRRIGFLYSAASQLERSQTDELIITNLSKLPAETRVWRTQEEWGRKTS